MQETAAPALIAAALRESLVRRRHRRLPGRADLHVHSCWSDGAQSPAAIVRAAAGQLDVIAVTDHDEIRGALEAREVARAEPGLGVEVIVGEEISTLNGHLIGLFLEERVSPGLNAERTIDLIHAQGGLAVAAHPFHPLRGRARGHRALGQLIPDLVLDAIEVVNNVGFFPGGTTRWPRCGTSSGCSRWRAGATPTTSGVSAARSRALPAGALTVSAVSSAPAGRERRCAGRGRWTSCHGTWACSSGVSFASWWLTAASGSWRRRRERTRA